jgi:3-methyladenine DNA glycosylase AlkD
LNASELIARLRALANPVNVAGMARCGINPHNTLGVPVAEIRRLARLAGRDHALALELWVSGIHEARILATIVDEPALVTRRQMQSWASDFDSWDVCDQACMNLFCRTDHAWAMAEKWSQAKAEYVRRAGFAMLASMASKRKQDPDEVFAGALDWVVRASTDDRNFVRKAVNWALRGIGKRNPNFREKAIAVSRRLREADSRSARWIGSDALRELTK